MPLIQTARLDLIPATPASLRAELNSPATLARVLGVEVPGSWPPELYDEGAVRWTLAALEHAPVIADWSFYYIARRPDAGTDASGLVGAGGYKGPPDAEGSVEIGYSVVPEHRRRGYAREAVDGWVAWAFADDRVTRVIAHTLVELAPSIGVLRAAGFSFVGQGNDPQEPSAVRYELTRTAYEATHGQEAPRR